MLTRRLVFTNYMFGILSIICFFMFLSPASTTTLRSVDTNDLAIYDRNNRRFYFKIFELSANFFQAETNCQRHFGHLASFNDVDEYEFLQTLYGNTDQLWLGLFNTGVSSQWNSPKFRFTDGTYFNITSWRNKYPYYIVNDNMKGYDLPRDLALKGLSNYNGYIYCSAVSVSEPNMWIIGVDCKNIRRAHVCKMNVFNNKLAAAENISTVYIYDTPDVRFVRNNYSARSNEQVECKAFEDQPTFSGRSWWSWSIRCEIIINVFWIELLVAIAVITLGLLIIYRFYRYLNTINEREISKQKPLRHAVYPSFKRSPQPDLCDIIIEDCTRESQIHAFS